MNDDWKKTQGDPENSWSRQEEDTWREASAWDENSDQKDVSGTAWEEPTGGDTTYSWVNPKLRKNTEEQKQGENFKKKYDSYQFSQPQPEPPVRKPKKSYGLLKKFGLCAALAVVFGLISGLIILGITSLGREEETVQVRQTVPATEPASTA